MQAWSLPCGKFTCRVTLEIVRAPTFARHDEGGVTYLTGRDYALAYGTVLRFASGDEFPIAAKLYGELNQQVVIRDDASRPIRVSGYTQGRSEITDADGKLIFKGRYYDSRIIQALMGDEALTPTGTRIVDHWENGFGHGAFAGHAIALGVRLTVESNVLGGGAPLSGEATGEID